MCVTQTHYISGDRLRAYERNNNFESEPVLLPNPLEVLWPTKGSQQLTKVDRDIIPKLCLEQIDLVNYLILIVLIN